MRLAAARFAVHREGFWAERAWVAVSACGWLLFAWATMSVPGGPGQSLATLIPGMPLEIPILASVVLGMTLLLVILMAGERAYWKASVRYIMFGGGLAAMLLLWQLNLNEPAYKPLAALALLAVALPLGYWVGDRMEKVTNLIPLAIAMSLADIFSLAHGPTKKIGEAVIAYQSEVSSAVAQSGPAAIEKLRAPFFDYWVVHFPIVGTGTTQPVLGIGDFIILGFLYRAAWVHHVSPKLILVSSCVSIIVAVCCAAVFDKPLPALPFIAVGVIGTMLVQNPRFRRLDRQEVVLSVVVVAIFSALVMAKRVGMIL